jgi:hypothetical protein
MRTAAEVFDEFAFDPQMVEVLAVAYAKVHRALNNPDLSAEVNEAIALEILALAKQGERDTDRICETTLATLGQSNLPEK